MSDLIERLRKMAATHERGFPVTILYSEISQALDIEAADRISALEKENAELRAALKPFQNYAEDEWTDHHGDETPILDEEGEFIAKLGDFRRARSALRDGGEK